jgi:hypothetical protein
MVFWCLRIKDHNWLYYGVGLLILLSVYIYIVYVTPFHAGFGFYGSVILAAIGLTAINLKPASIDDQVFSGGPVYDVRAEYEGLE